MKRCLVLLGLLALVAGCSANRDQPPAVAQPSPVPPGVEQPPAPQPVQTTVKPSLTITLLDPSGRRPDETVFHQDGMVSLSGRSPDGRYLLLARPVGTERGDRRAVPILLDRETGDLKQGTVLELGEPVWSGRGFWVSTLVHLSLDLQVERYHDLRQSLADEKPLIAAAVTPDGTRAAAVLGPVSKEGRATLVIAVGDGQPPIRLPDVISVWESEMGPSAGLAWSPDGATLALTAREPALALIDPVSPGRDSWRVLPFDGVFGKVLWAPGGKRLWVSGLGILDASGREVLRAERSDMAGWNAEGTLLTFVDRSQRPPVSRVWSTDSSLRAIPLPPGTWLAGQLPDGRLLVVHYGIGVY